MSSVQFEAMGTTVTVWTETPADVATTAGIFEDVEEVCSRFRPSSQLSVLNRMAPPQVVSHPLLLGVLHAAIEARDLSGGCVDAAVGEAVAGWGYDRTFDEVEGLFEAPAVRDVPAWQLAGDRVLANTPVVFDLGGIAKGWAVDLAFEATSAHVVDAGGDLRSRHPETIVHIEDPGSDSVAATVRLGVGALATSSTAKRSWQVDGREVCHLIDPRSGAPIETPVVSASAVAATAVAAETAAKSVLIRGEQGLAWADAQPWIRGAMAVWADGAVYGTADLEVI